MTKRHTADLRKLAVEARLAAAVPTTGGRYTDAMLIALAQRLEREADEIEGKEAT
jgi:hypothetical protein